MTVSSAFTISRRTESFCFSRRRICIGECEWVPPLKSLRSARSRPESNRNVDETSRRFAQAVYVWGIKWTLLIFRPTAISFSPATASPGSWSSVNDSILHQAADDPKPELEVDAQCLADLRYESGRLLPQVLHDGRARLGLCPGPDDDHLGVPKLLNVRFDCSLQEFRSRLHVHPADQVVNLPEKFGWKAERNCRFSHLVVLHVLHVLHDVYLTSCAPVSLHGSSGSGPKGPCARFTIQVR